MSIVNLYAAHYGAAFAAVSLLYAGTILSGAWLLRKCGALR
jgi:hypothetical protein